MRAAFMIWAGGMVLAMTAAIVIGLAGSVLDTYRAFTQPAACQAER